MTMFFLRTCDRAGQVLSNRCVEARDVYGALARANQHLQAFVLGSGQQRVDPLGRIDVADRNGHTVARLVCAEAIATSGKAQ